jgi:gamma-glutamyltranspeptidase
MSRYESNCIAEVMKLKVKDHDDLVRDTQTQAVLNSDLTSLQAYKKRRDALRKKDSELESLKEEVSELKDLVHKLLAEKSK